MLGPVAVVLLTEAESSLVPPLGHAAVVDQPQVDVDLVRAGPSENFLCQHRERRRYLFDQKISKTLSIILLSNRVF